MASYSKSSLGSIDKDAIIGMVRMTFSSIINPE